MFFAFALQYAVKKLSLLETETFLVATWCSVDFCSFIRSFARIQRLKSFFFLLEIVVEILYMYIFDKIFSVALSVCKISYNRNAGMGWNRIRKNTTQSPWNFPLKLSSHQHYLHYMETHFTHESLSLSLSMCVCVWCDLMCCQSVRKYVCFFPSSVVCRHLCHFHTNLLSQDKRLSSSLPLKCAKKHKTKRARTFYKHSALMATCMQHTM